MKIHVPAISLFILALASSAALAVGPGKQVELNSTSENAVTFDGTVHKNAGLTCADCHNKDIFPVMKQGTVKITLKELLEGKYCGKCHNGERAFSIKDNCIRCHFFPGA